jgi:hypothetical protein
MSDQPNKPLIGVTRDRCRKFNWVLEFDVKGLLYAASYCPPTYEE